MNEMFVGATSFDQDIDSWAVTSLTDATDMFTGVTLSTANYESLLIGWDAQALRPGVAFSGGNSMYCSAAAVAARANMIASDSWDIIDGGQCSEIIFHDGFEYLDGVFQINTAISDVWVFPATSGQGFHIIVWEGLKQIFLLWFTYDTERPPEDVTAILGEPGHRWLTAMGPYNGDTALLDVFVSSGGIFDSGDPPVTEEQLAGARIDIVWTGCNEGVLTYNIPSLGLSGEIPIQRAIALDYMTACLAAQPQ